MSDKRRGLGRGLGALIPSAPSQRPAGERPVDVFFPERDGGFTGNNAKKANSSDDGGAGSPDRISHDGAKPAADSDRGSAQDPGTSGSGSAGGASAGAGDGAVADGAAVDGAATAAARTADSTANGEAAVTELPDGLVPVPGAHFAELPLTQITPNPRQPREVFDPEALAELVHSIREIGVLQPVVVRRVDGTPPEGFKGDPAAPRYELVMGERRWRASQEAGQTTIPAIVRDTTDDDMLRDALLENLHRSELNPLEEAAAYQQLLDDFGCTHDELAQRIGRSRPQISNTLRLMKLPPLVQRRVAAGVLSAGHARALLGMADAAAMERLAQRIVAEGLSVRTTEEIVALGDAEGNEPVTRRRARPGDRHAALDELASRLSDRFDTRVKIALGQRKGKVTIEFATVDDLNRIVGVLVPGEDGLFRGSAGIDAN
ncbi:MAG TPA: ParB/RepB/Spo0J family partition protein [Actinomycetales bacterium]|nr:ParB/RepB/Spo0J family partition protein [Actinomycetales bacterium]